MNHSSVEAERSVLGCLMTKGQKAAELLNNLDDSSFYFGWHKEIFSAVNVAMSTGLSTDAIAVNEKTSIEIEIGYLLELQEDHTDVQTALSYATILNDHKLSRELDTLALSITQQLEEKADPNQIINFIQDKLIGLTQNTSDQIVPIKESMKRYVEDLQTRFDSKEMSGVPTGISKFDQVSNGLQKEELIILSGTPGSGKTTLAFKIMMAASQKKPVYFASQEMAEGQLMQRMTSNLGSVPMSRLTSGQLITEDWPGLAVAVNKAKVYNDNLIIDYSASVSTNYLRMKGNEIRLKHGDLGLMVIDYFGLMEQPKGQTLYESSIFNAVALNRLKKELKCNILVLAQLNKDTLKSGKRPGIGDLDWGGQLAKDADGIFFLYTNDQMKKDNVVQFYSDKTRSMQSINMHFDNNLGYNRLEEREHEYQEPVAEGKIQFKQ